MIDAERTLFQVRTYSCINLRDGTTHIVVTDHIRVPPRSDTTERGRDLHTRPSTALFGSEKSFSNKEGVMRTHLPLELGSGVSRNEAMASPIVTMCLFEQILRTFATLEAMTVHRNGKATCTLLPLGSHLARAP